MWLRFRKTSAVDGGRVRDAPAPPALVKGSAGASSGIPASRRTRATLTDTGSAYPAGPRTSRTRGDSRPGRLTGPGPHAMSVGPRIDGNRLSELDLTGMGVGLTRRPAPAEVAWSLSPLAAGSIWASPSPVRLLLRQARVVDQSESCSPVAVAARSMCRLLTQGSLTSSSAVHTTEPVWP